MSPPKNRFKSIRNAFITGLVILLPVSVTLVVVQFLIVRIGEPASAWLFYFLKGNLRGYAWVETFLNIVSTFVVVFLITLLGYLSQYFFGRWLIGLVEGLFSKLPFVKSVYKTVKQIVETFRSGDKPAFQSVVLVEFPKAGNYSIAFLTSTQQGEPQKKVGERLVNVFMPTTPNPTTGFLILLPESQIKYLDMTVGDAMKFIISGGTVVPSAELPTST
ncbi:MAG TPA: DUF502 domain-containing protein [Opitutales bacterium]|nr:DUF502 domain-containing protein [Opitutales bacterium]